MIWVWIAWAFILTFGIIVFRGAPYVPSRKRYITYAFTVLYPLSKKDVLVDIGSGDGVVLREASNYAKKAIGYELNPILVVISRFLSRRQQKVHVVLRDFWLTQLPPETTVVYAFMASPYINKLQTKMQHEANRSGKPLRLILYGNTLSEKTVDNQGEGYRLYTFVPLQTDEA